MAEDSSFTNEGSIHLTLPVTIIFEKTLFEFVKLVAAKAGYESRITNKIAESVLRKVFSYIDIDRSRKPNRQVKVSFSHRQKHVAVQIELPELNICEVEEY